MARVLIFNRKVKNVFGHALLRRRPKTTSFRACKSKNRGDSNNDNKKNNNNR